MRDPPQGHPERRLRASLPMFAQDGENRQGRDAPRTARMFLRPGIAPELAPQIHPGQAPRFHPKQAYIYFTARVKSGCEGK